MGKIIPYFYTDLIARIVPGAVLIAFVRITTLPMPKPWMAIAESEILGSAQAVIVPILFAGLAYVLGTVLDALLSNWLEDFQIYTFDRALKKYSPLYEKPNNGYQKTSRSIKDLSRAAFGHLITSPSDNIKLAIPHLLRFHSEAKMCFSSMIILAGFFLLAIVNKCTESPLIRQVESAYLWYAIILLTIVFLWYTTYDRLKNRVFFITKTIERSAVEDEFEDTKKLRGELLAFGNPRKLKN